MKVVLDRSLFVARPQTQLTLLDLVAPGWECRHAILCDPPFDYAAREPVNDWIAELSPDLSQEVQLVLDDGNLQATKLPPDTAQIRASAVPASDWRRGVLTPVDAVRIMRAPLRLLLENRLNDFQFLLRLCPPQRRQELKEALNLGWVELSHGGGLPGMTERLKDLVDFSGDDPSANIARLRLWVMFDADAHEEDRTRPSGQSMRVKELCQQVTAMAAWPLNHHQLGRRAIESYLPTKLLEVWEDDAHGHERTERRRKRQALCELEKLRPLARWQYNMKKGLFRDLSRELREEIEKEGRDIRDEELDPLFQGLDQEARRSLKHGFGEHIAKLFWREIPGVEEWFQAEYARGPAHQPDREAVLDSLFARM